MKWAISHDPDGTTTITIEVTEGDMQDAEYLPRDLEMVRLLQAQQDDDPTCEGLLMIAQIHVAAVERGARHAVVFNEKEEAA